MKDSYCRSVDYLRISVTDRCNLRCVYCSPNDDLRGEPLGDVLSCREIVRVARVAASLGVRRVRLTGGEPLMRPDLPDLVAAISCIRGVEEVTLTTNGLLLANQAESLARAGLRRVNVSLDTLTGGQLRRISGTGMRPTQVLQGIRAAERAGLTPIKVNTVVVRGYNDKSLADLARLTLLESWHVRFIEVMPMGDCAAWNRSRFVPVAEMVQTIESRLGPLVAATPPRGGGPARYYQLPGGRATIGFISPISDHFCDTCNRLRLSADGRLLSCLWAHSGTDLRAALRNGSGLAGLQTLFERAVAVKPNGHLCTPQPSAVGQYMGQIGG